MNKHCYICKKEIKDSQKLIAIKEKILFEDYDGIWYNFKKSYICLHCISIIREMVKKEA